MVSPRSIPGNSHQPGGNSFLLHMSNPLNTLWYPLPDSNRHAIRQQILSLLCLANSIKGARENVVIGMMADGEGFEPSERFLARWFSRPEP